MQQRAVRANKAFAHFWSFGRTSTSALQLQAVLLAAGPWAAVAYDPTCPLGSNSEVTCTAQGWTVLSLILLVVAAVGCLVRYCRLPDREREPAPLATATGPNGVEECEVEAEVTPRTPRALQLGEERTETQREELELDRPVQDKWKAEASKLSGDWDCQGLEVQPEMGFTPSVDVVLECVESAGMDVKRLDRWQRSIISTVVEGKPVRVGPRHQPQLFSHLFRDMASPHSDLFELALDKPCLYLKRLALDMPLLMNGVPLRQPAFVLWHRVEIGLCFTEGGAPHFTFRVLLDPASNRPVNCLDTRRKALSEDCLCPGPRWKARIIV